MTPSYLFSEFNNPSEMALREKLQHITIFKRKEECIVFSFSEAMTKSCRVFMVGKYAPFKITCNCVRFSITPEFRILKLTFRRKSA